MLADVTSGFKRRRCGLGLNGQGGWRSAFLRTASQERSQRFLQRVEPVEAVADKGLFNPHWTGYFFDCVNRNLDIRADFSELIQLYDMLRCDDIFFNYNIDAKYDALVADKGA